MQAQGASGPDDVGNRIGYSELYGDLHRSVESDHRRLDSPGRQIFSDQVRVRGRDALARQIGDGPLPTDRGGVAETG